MLRIEEKLTNKLFFTVEDIQRLLSISRPSARVFCTRKLKQGAFLRCKKNMYVLAASFKNLADYNLFQYTAYLQTPSYISCLTALSYYGISTQVPQNIIESISIKKTVTYTVATTTFSFIKIAPSLFNGFLRTQLGFIASPEKALLDTIYLTSFGKYALDTDALDITKIDTTILTPLLAQYPLRTQKRIQTICQI